MLTSDYISLIPSANRNKPKFVAMISLLVSWSVDTQALLGNFAALFNLDLAVGQQLDFIGLWVGITRGASGSDLVLDDQTYRTLLKAVIAINHWNGTVPGIYAIWDTVFDNSITVLVQDNQDMSMFIVFTQQAFTPAELVLLHDGAFDLRPAGVKMLGYFQPSAVGFPVFGLDVENASISGLNVGYIVEPL